MSLFCRKVAFRYLRSRRQQGFVSVIAGFSFLGILLGVATLIIVMSVMNGFRHELLGRILGINGHVAVYANHGHLSDYDVLADQIRGIPGVTGVFPMVERQTMAMSSSLTRGALVHGLTREALIQRPLIAHKVQAGRHARRQGHARRDGPRQRQRQGPRRAEPPGVGLPRPYSASDRCVARPAC